MKHKEQKSELWLHDFGSLFKNMGEFWPSQSYDNNRQINAIVRYILYASILFSYLYSTSKFLLIGISMALVITFMIKNCQGYSMKEVMINLHNEHKRQEAVSKWNDRPMSESVKRKPKFQLDEVNNPHKNPIPPDTGVVNDTLHETDTDFVKEKHFSAYDNIGDFSPIQDDPLNRYGSMQNFYTIPKKDHEQYKDFMYGDMSMKTNNYYL